MYWPYFSFGCSLEINTQRTAAYIKSAETTCGAGDIKSKIDLTCECDPLHWVFDDVDIPHPATYTNPSSDQAPWYDGSIPESAQFLGFMIEDVVVNAVTARNITTRVSSSGGGVLGPMRSNERRLDFTVLLFACNELAMDYGFRYLTDSLSSSGCDPDCTLCDAEYRESCPKVDGSIASLNKGRWLLKNIGALGAPVWADPPLEGSSCNMRRVTFSLASELPWKFKCSKVECTQNLASGLSNGSNCVNWSTILCGQQRVFCSVSEDLVVGETGLIITIKAGSVDLKNLSIDITPDKFNVCGTGTIGLEPCDSIRIPYIPSGATLVYDTSVESITVMLAGGGSVDGTPYVATTSGTPPTFPSLRCGHFCVSVGASECSVIGSPTVTVSSVHREF